MAQMTLEQLVERLRSALGDGLRAVVLYGSAAGVEHHAAHSDYNVLVLVDRLGRAELGPPMAKLTAVWREGGNPPLLLLTMSEWRGSADIFPMEYADIFERHQVLYGALPRDGIVVAPANLRLQVEHESMAKLLQLRTGLLQAGNDVKRQRALLAASLSTFMAIFRGIERLHEAVPPADYESLVKSVARRAGFDPDPWVRVVRHRRGNDRLEEPEQVLGAYLEGAEKLVAYLDVFTPGNERTGGDRVE